MDCSLLGFSVHGISQTRILEWDAIFSSRGFFWPRDQTFVSWIGRWILYHWATNLPMKKPFIYQWKGSPFIPFSSVQSLSHVQLFATPWITECHVSLITNSQRPPKPMSIKSMMPSNHLILCHPLLLLPSIFPSIRVFSNESDLRIRCPKYWSFSFNTSPSNEHSGLIFFRMDWLDLLAVQGTLKSLLQHHSSKASSALRFLYSPTLTSIYDYWKNHSFD